MIKDVSAILNAIRETSSNAYQTAVPFATAENIVDVGEAVLGLPTSVIQNEFIYAVNKIIMTTIDTMDFSNPLSGLKKGKLPYGMSIEDLYIEAIESIPYIAGTRAEEEAPDQYEIFKVDNKAAYYQTQLERQYAYTVHRNDLRRAFRSASGFGEWLSKLAEAQRSGEEWDDYRMTVALLARQIEESMDVATYYGEISLVTDYNAIADTPVTAESALSNSDFLRYFANQVKKYSDRIKFPRSDFNIAEVVNNTPKTRQRLMMLQDVEADIDTNLLYSAFNIDKLEIGSFDGIDAWYSVGALPSGSVASPDQLEAKGLVTADGAPVIALLFDRDMVKIYNKVREQSQADNARGLYYNTFITLADIYACSPFTNFVYFTLG